MYKRVFTPPRHHFLLLGPRSTGKSTWLRRAFPGALYFDLLRTSEYLRLSQDPDEFRNRVLGSKAKVVIVDEIQRMPDLLNEAQALMLEAGARKFFVLTGSSARKLRRSSANLLAGRVLTKHFFPLVSSEFGFRKRDLDNVLKFGLLPQIRGQEDPGLQTDLLEAYADTYLRQEVKEEALVRKLEPFSRFLRVAALMNGQILNLSNIARDAEVKRPTAEGYFEVLTDTLLGFSLPAWRPKAKVKENASPKFYFFDPGVARVLSGKHLGPVEDAEKGFLLETFVLNEIRAYLAYRNVKATVSYWGNPSESEIDFIVTNRSGHYGIEVKSSKRWRGEDQAVLKEFKSKKILRSACGVYLGESRMNVKGIVVYPLDEFLESLWRGELFGNIETP